MPNTEFCDDPATFFILDRLRSNAEGLDKIPARFLRLLILVCIAVIQLILKSSTIPEQWQVARIRPVANTKTANGPGDFRPISVVPVL